MRASFSSRRQRRRHEPTSASRRKTALVVCVSAPACDAGASVLARAATPWTPRWRRRSRSRSRIRPPGNIGGGGFMIVRTPSGEVDGLRLPREGAARSRRGRCTSAHDGKIDRSLTAAGYLAPGVPGTVRGLALAHKKLRQAARGRTSSCPAIAARRAGLPRSRRPRARPEPRTSAGRWRASRRRSPRTESRAAESGQPAIAWYSATSPRRSAPSPTAAPTRSTKVWIADRDRRGHESQRRPDHEGRPRRVPGQGTRAAARHLSSGYEIVSMPPVSSGGVALIEMLNILEPFDLKAKGLAHRAGAAPADRGDATGLSRSRALPRRSRISSRCRSHA